MIFYSVLDCPWLAPCALVLDLLLGDPPLPWPHPVCIVGGLMNKMEGKARLFISRGSTLNNRKIRALAAGFFSLFLLVLAFGSLSLLLISLPYLGPLFALYLAWSGLAMGCLLHTGKVVLEKIENSSLSDARIGVSWLVSRDVSQMDRKVLQKTLADTLSENFTDAFVAPFFWLLVTGPAGLWIYKTVSTMDSQWGYMTPKWKDLGFFGARSDDYLAFLPARISVFLFFVTNKILTLIPALKKWPGNLPSFQIIARQARQMPSPNSGWSMTACSWLCEGHMAGPSVYFGEMVMKPWLGPPDEKNCSWDKKKLLALCDLLFYSTIIGGSFMWIICFIPSLPFL